MNELQRLGKHLIDAERSISKAKSVFESLILKTGSLLPVEEVLPENKKFVEPTEDEVYKEMLT